MDGKETKTGVAVVAAGGALSTLSVFGVEIAPDSVLQTVAKVLELFGYHYGPNAEPAAQALVGGLLSFVGGAVALYDYYRKGELVTK